MGKATQRGQALILVVTVVGLVLAGALGLAIDSSQLYGHRQMAQAAADAAAEAGILTSFGGTVTNATLAAKTCVNGTDTTTPCQYAFKNGFGNSGTSTDTITVDFPGSVTGVGAGSLSPKYTPNIVHVVITRPVKSLFMALLGAPPTNVKAAATAAITIEQQPPPIEVLHPTLSGSLSLGGSAGITITGGPTVSIQINSSSLTAVAQNGTSFVNLAGAGPTATGGDFGVWGGPASTGLPSWLTGGTTTHYDQPNPPFNDPFEPVVAPTQPAAAPAPITTGVGTTGGTGDCPAGASHCTIYFPGYYSNAIVATNDVYIFNPGLYYVDGVSSKVGFGMGANGDMQMCSGVSTDGQSHCVVSGPKADTTGCCTVNGGMTIYMTNNAGVVNVGANSGSALKGEDVDNTQLDTSWLGKAFLFFGAHNMAAHNQNGNGVNQYHTFGGGGSLSLTGTIYLTNCKEIPCTSATSSVYQGIRLGGNASNGTEIHGQIITDAIIIQGTPQIRMFLDPQGLLVPINYVGLVK